MYLSVHIYLSKPLVHMKLNSELKEMGTLVHYLLWVRVWGMHEPMKKRAPFHSLPVTRWSYFVVRYSLQNHSLLVEKFACYSLQTHSLHVARCKFAHCFLLVTQSVVASYSLHIHSLLATCCKFTHCLLHFAEVTPYKKSLIICCTETNFFPSPSIKSEYLFK